MEVVKGRWRCAAERRQRQTVFSSGIVPPEGRSNSENPQPVGKPADEVVPMGGRYVYSAEYCFGGEEY